MPKFVIEREMPGVGQLSQIELQGASQVASQVVKEMGPQIQWVNSFVTSDKVYCVYVSPDERTLKEHAQRSGLPINRVSPIATIIDPLTAEG